VNSWLILLAVIVAVSLSACSPSPPYAHQEMILCDPGKGAWFVRPNLGQTAFTKRVPHLDAVCQEHQSQSQEIGKERSVK
jgi:hypothetical protein